MDFLQNLIHRLEVGGGMKYLRILVGLLAVLAFAFLYNWRAYRNMSCQEAMDAAQLARNVAEGKGWNTYFIRPFSIYLLNQCKKDTSGALEGFDPSHPFGAPPAKPESEKETNAPAAPVDSAVSVKTLESMPPGESVSSLQGVGPAGPVPSARLFAPAQSTDLPAPGLSALGQDAAGPEKQPGELAIPSLSGTNQANVTGVENALSAPDANLTTGKAHPDLANPFLYPWVLSRLMKWAPFFHFSKEPVDMGTKYSPDLLISFFNQLLWFVIVYLVYRLARRLFEKNVARLSALLLLGTELYWRFTFSGLSTMLVLLIFTCLAWCLVWMEGELTEPRRGPKALYVYASLAGALVSLGLLTRYSFGWLIIPVLGFIFLVGGNMKWRLAAVAGGVFLLTLSGLVLNNYRQSGEPFGTATYTYLEGTFQFPGNKLQQSLSPDLHQSYTFQAVRQKLFSNTRQIIQTDLPKLGGSWVSAFALVGLFLSFQNSGARRLRAFLVFSLLTLIVVQALGKTQLSEDSPEINSENLLVLLGPFILLYGVSLFYLLLDQLALPMRELRYAVIALFTVVMCLPMLLVFTPPKNPTVVYPPYSPRAIQTLAAMVKPNEVIMSDVPWAVAWYGHRKSAWLTLKVTAVPSDVRHEDFYTMNDSCGPIVMLYLTPMTTDRRFWSDWLVAEEFRGWGSFYFRVMSSPYRKREGWPEAGMVSLEYSDLPFLLRHTQQGWAGSGQFFLADWPRWGGRKYDL